MASLIPIISGRVDDLLEKQAPSKLRTESLFMMTAKPEVRRPDVESNDPSVENITILSSISLGEGYWMKLAGEQIIV